MLYLIFNVFWIIRIILTCTSTSRHFSFHLYIYPTNSQKASETLVVWKGIRAGSNLSKTGPRAYPFTTPTAVLPGSDAGSDGVEPASIFIKLSIIYHRGFRCIDDFIIKSSIYRKAVRLRVPCRAPCMEHAIRTWSAVYSKAPHSQFNEGARPYLCMDE